MDRPARIIVADDEEHIGYLVKFQMEKAGFEVDWKLDGRSALDAIRADLPDLVILDVIMPGLTGFEVLQQLKSDPSTEHIPVILLSALGNEEDLVKAFELGAADYVVKPFRTGELLARVRRLIPGS